MADSPTQAFQWGANGARMTPEDIAAQKKVAAAMMEKGADYSPVRSAWQGVARAAQGVLGGYQDGEASKAAAANAADNKAMIAALLGGGGMTAAAPAAPSVATAGTVPASLSAAPVARAPDTTGKIYSNDEPSPLDAPTGQDRINMVATALGEEPAGSPAGLGAINTIRTRAIDGGYGGDTPTGVVLAPKQYSANNDPAHRAALLARATANTPEVAKVSDAIDQTYGVGKYVNAGPNDPTEGKTHYYDPASMVPPGAVPLWAQGKPFQQIGQTRFYDDPDEPAAKPVQVASAAPVAFAAPAAAPSPGVAALTAAANGTPAPGVAKVTGALSGVNPAVLQAATSPYADDATKRIAGIMLTAQLGKEKKDTYSPQVDADGNQLDVNNTTHERKMVVKAAEDPTSVKEYEFYKKNMPAGQTPMDYGTFSTAKARANATNVTTNVDMNATQTYDKQLAEGLGKSHAALANGVEDAQTRARDIAGMQGAIDAIQRNGGTTGGMGAAQVLELKKTLNSGATSLGMGQPFDENSLSDAELMQKLNRQMAGAQAKSAVGARVTNFDMQNYLAANPGLSLSPTANQRLLGIQAQVEQRNIAVGNAIRDATAQSISSGKKIDPVTVQGIITDYDKAHHVQDPITGQDLTQSYTLPEFQQADQGNNAALAVGHETNIGNIKIKRIN